MTDVLDRLRQTRVVPVIVIEDPRNAAPLAGALAAGGLPCAEVTFRTPAAAESIRRMVDAHPDVLVGAGTVLSPAQVDAAIEAGAAFVVSPGFNPAVVDACQARGIPVYPGVCTPTEVEAALGKGLDVLKFFPAEPVGGLPLLKAIAAPYVGVRFMPTGGIHRGNVRDYLALDRVVACGGSWMAPPEWIRAGDWDRIRQEAETTSAMVHAPEAA